MEEWFRALNRSEEKPIAQQERFLLHVMSRCAIVEQELRSVGGHAPQKKAKLTDPDLF